MRLLNFSLLSQKDLLDFLNENPEAKRARKQRKAREMAEKARKDPKVILTGIAIQIIF